MDGSEYGAEIFCPTDYYRGVTMAKLDDAIAAVLEASKPQGCWASHLKGDAAKFVTRLQEEEKKGMKISRTATQKVLADAFSVKIGTNAIKDHLTAVCSCE